MFSMSDKSVPHKRRLFQCTMRYFTKLYCENMTHWDGAVCDGCFV